MYQSQTKRYEPGDSSSLFLGGHLYTFLEVDRNDGYSMSLIILMSKIGHIYEITDIASITVVLHSFTYTYMNLLKGLPLHQTEH